MKVLKCAELLVLMVIIGLSQNAQCLTPTNFLKRMGLFGAGMSNDDLDNMGVLNRVFKLLSQMRNNVESGVEYADYLDSIMPQDTASTEPRYFQNHFLRIGRSSQNMPTEESKRSRSTQSRFVRIGKSSRFQKRDVEDDINSKRSRYLRIGKLPSATFLNYAFGHPSRSRDFKNPHISRSTVLRLG